MSEKKQVAIIMGSDSDLPIMQQSAIALEGMGIGCDIMVSSAHRHTEKTVKFASGAAGEGIEVIIAGAGGAAHLPGVIAAVTILPVIGVPVYTESLGGVDSLYSIVQMPRGIPVATVAINGAFNAGLLAAQILALKDENLRKKLEEYRRSLAEGVDEKDRVLHEKGFRRYIKENL